jgi:hypothetical protein
VALIWEYCQAYTNTNTSTSTSKPKVEEKVSPFFTPSKTLANEVVLLQDHILVTFFDLSQNLGSEEYGTLPPKEGPSLTKLFQLP